MVTSGELVEKELVGLQQSPTYLLDLSGLLQNGGCCEGPRGHDRLGVIRELDQLSPAELLQQIPGLQNAAIYITVPGVSTVSSTLAIIPVLTAFKHANTCRIMAITSSTCKPAPQQSNAQAFTAFMASLWQPQALSASPFARWNA